jgi:hypothetical protein
MENEMTNLTNEQMVALAAELTKQLAELKAGRVQAAPRSHNPWKPSATRKYVLLSKQMKDWGKVPQQQRDIASILAENLEVGKEYTEVEVASVIMAEASKYPQLANSKMDPTYIFRYYRGLGDKDGKHAGYIKRDFIRVIG